MINVRIITSTYWLFDNDWCRFLVLSWAWRAGKSYINLRVSTTNQLSRFRRRLLSWVYVFSLFHGINPEVWSKQFRFSLSVKLIWVFLHFFFYCSIIIIWIAFNLNLRHLVSDRTTVQSAWNGRRKRAKNILFNDCANLIKIKNYSRIVSQLPHWKNLH